MLKENRVHYDEFASVLLVGEYDQAGNLIQELVWLGDIPVATIRTDQSGGSVGVFYIHADHLNAPTKITRPSDNQIIWRWDHDPYGNGIPNQDPDGNGLSLVFNLRFPGQYYDAETGLYYNWERYYDPQIGRYLESDPIGLEGGSPSTYLYVGGDPLSFIDTKGLQIVPPEAETEREREEDDQMNERLLEEERPEFLKPLSYYTGGSPNQCGVCLRIYFIARVEGRTRAEHSASANLQFYNFLQSPRGPLRGPSMAQAMRGPMGLNNPMGFVWHHPWQSRNELWLVQQCDHLDPEFQDLLHPGGSGGFSRYYAPSK